MGKPPALPDFMTKITPASIVTPPSMRGYYKEKGSEREKGDGKGDRGKIKGFDVEEESSDFQRKKQKNVIPESLI